MLYFYYSYLQFQVIELMGSTITQVGCGRQHCLALVPSRGRVYSFGIGGSGQLGVRKTNSAYTPQAVLGPWVSPGGSSLIPSDNKNGPNLVIRRLFAGNLLNNLIWRTVYVC